MASVENREFVRGSDVDPYIFDCTAAVIIPSRLRNLNKWSGLPAPWLPWWISVRAGAPRHNVTLVGRESFYFFFGGACGIHTPIPGYPNLTPVRFTNADAFAVWSQAQLSAARACHFGNCITTAGMCYIWAP